MRLQGAAMHPSMMVRGRGIGSMVSIVCLLSFFQQVQFRVFRASLFAALGMWGVVPAIHILITSWGKPPVMNAVSHAMVMGLIYLVRSYETLGPTSLSLWWTWSVYVVKYATS